MKSFYIYILTNKRRGLLYTGVTSNLLERVYNHRKRLSPGFTSKYGLYKLVYFEKHDSAWEAIHREKCIKKWYRQWKIDLVERVNPGWRDVYYDIIFK